MIVKIPSWGKSPRGRGILTAVGDSQGSGFYGDRFRGRTFVIKLGGPILNRAHLGPLAEDIAGLVSAGVRPVIVHGGSFQVRTMARRLRIRVPQTTGAAAGPLFQDLIKMVYRGTLNTDIVSSLWATDTPAIGVSGVDAGLLALPEFPGIGAAGEDLEADAGLLSYLRTGGFVPVVAPLAMDTSGGVAEVASDWVASRLACALRAEKLIIMSDQDGATKDDDPPELLSYTDPDGAQRLEESSGLAGGMAGKLSACRKAVLAGVPRAHIINGTKPRALLVEVFTKGGCGTMIASQPELARYLRE